MLVDPFEKENRIYYWEELFISFFLSILNKKTNLINYNHLNHVKNKLNWDGYFLNSGKNFA